MQTRRLPWSPRCIGVAPLWVGSRKNSVRRSPSTSLTRGRLQTFTPPLSTLPMCSDRKADSRSRIHLLPWRRVRGRGTVSDNLGRSSSPHALAGLVRTFREQKRQTQDTTEALPSMRHSPTASIMLAVALATCSERPIPKMLWTEHIRTNRDIGQARMIVKRSKFLRTRHGTSVIEALRRGEPVGLFHLFQVDDVVQRRQRHTSFRPCQFQLPVVVSWTGL
jgi:hypothetical protein